MPELSPSTNTANPPPASPRYHLAVLLAIAVFAISGTFFAEILFPDLIFKNETLHTFLESIGAVSALTLTIMIMLSQSGQDDSSLAFVSAAGLICMSVFDAMHSIVPPGSLFVWLRSSSTFLGGFFFALSWITPNHWLARSGKRMVWLVLLMALLLGLASMWFASSLPLMVSDGQFTFAACAINFAGGLLFLAASARYLKLHDQSRQLQ
ncbi:MAG: hypothetical protein RL748_1386, partial [Pseudomonadota bacterium]